MRGSIPKQKQWVLTLRDLALLSSWCMHWSACGVGWCRVWRMRQARWCRACGRTCTACTGLMSLLRPCGKPKVEQNNMHSTVLGAWGNYHTLLVSRVGNRGRRSIPVAAIQINYGPRRFTGQRRWKLWEAPGVHCRYDRVGNMV